MERFFIVAIAVACMLLATGFLLIVAGLAHSEEWRGYRFVPNSPAYQKRLEWRRREEWRNHRYWQGDHWERGYPPGWERFQ